MPPLLLAAFLMSGGAASPEPAVAQETPQEEPEAATEVEAPIEWNFRPVPVAGSEDPASLQERWEAPFAVVSRGRPAPREPRGVVIPGAVEVARRTAVVAADSGETVAVVEVEGTEVGRVVAAVTGEDEGEGVEGAAGSAGATEGEDGAGAESEAESEAESDAEPEDEAPGGSSAAASAGEGGTHRVRYGETWFGLARQYRVSARDLAAANPEVDPERLRAGTVLRIPGAEAADTAPRTHTVVRGDTLFGIARRYGVSAAAIRTANRLPNDIVRLGQTLVIPREEASR